jgi:23S rRNA (cytosine1962-C5)-methyltransferase
MYLSDQWLDYEVIDAGSGEKLERWGDRILLRPDPQAIWPAEREHPAWERIDAIYHRSAEGGGSWEFKAKLPEPWTVTYGELKFKIKPLGFKHTGLFPEQAVHWDWMRQRIAAAAQAGSGREPLNVLNLFAYTGGATLACAAAGACVTHVDAARGMVNWAGENLELSGLAGSRVRFLVDDCLKFVQREERRGRKYDAVIMDPPSFGRGPGGETWKLEERLFELVSACLGILSEKPVFFLINSYTTGLQPLVLENMLKMTVVKRFGGAAEAAEVGLPITATGLVLPCGASGRWIGKP